MGPLDHPYARPLLILAACVLGLALIDAHDVLTIATAASSLETFATIGLVALGLGLTMMIREFDLSVVGMYSMAGCIAVVMGGDNAWLGLACALAAGLAGGLLQGWIIVRLRLGSVGVTLGGLLVFAGIAYVVTENRALPYENMAVALRMSAPIAGVFSIRSLVAIAIFLCAAPIFGLTRYGRDIIAIGSDRRAAMTAGVNVDALVIGIFGFSGVCAALSGALLSYSLASASPAGLSDVIVPAAAAAILGGVSLAGGTGRPLGIAVGVLSLALLRAGFNAIGAPPYANEIAMGAILLLVAVLDGAHLARRLAWLRR
ncbi:MAG TPA: ABC transporter permease [Xanthobacteraceae bacterium]|jgi:ribose/xylose/arabinose/galactoside ABC-type transport system permease subunit